MYVYGVRQDNKMRKPERQLSNNIEPQLNSLIPTWVMTASVLLRASRSSSFNTTSSRSYRGIRSGSVCIGEREREREDERG